MKRFHPAPPARMSKRACKRAGVSFHGRVNDHMVHHTLLVVVDRPDGSTVHYYCHGMVAVIHPAHMTGRL